MPQVLSLVIQFLGQASQQTQEEGPMPTSTYLGPTNWLLQGQCTRSPHVCMFDQHTKTKVHVPHPSTCSTCTAAPTFALVIGIDASMLPVCPSPAHSATHNPYLFIVALAYLFIVASQPRYPPPPSVPPGCVQNSLRCTAYDTFCYGMS